MSIHANSIIVHGALSGNQLYANTVSGSNAATISIMNDINVNGNVFTKGRLDFSDTIFMTMRPTADVQMSQNEHFITGYDMILDAQASDPTTLSALTDVTKIWNWMQGSFTVPLDGLYTLEVQGSFSNAVADSTNGVYWYRRNHAYPNARIAANITKSPIVFSSTTQYLLKDDVVQPAFHSSDPNSVLLANGETFLAFLVSSTVSVDHSKFYRIPASSNA